MAKFVCYALRFVPDAEARMISQESSSEVSARTRTISVVETTTTTISLIATTIDPRIIKAGAEKRRI
jgi:hypothetical protein